VGNPLIALKPAPGFDYATLDPETRRTLEGCRAAIRAAANAAVVEIGRALLTAQAALAKPGSGSFLAWVEAEFGMPSATAYRWIEATRIADRLSPAEKDGAAAGHFDGRDLLALARQPRATREQVVERVRGGAAMRPAIAQVRAETEAVRGIWDDQPMPVPMPPMPAPVRSAYGALTVPTLPPFARIGGAERSADPAAAETAARIRGFFGQVNRDPAEVAAAVGRADPRLARAYVEHAARVADWHARFVAALAQRPGDGP